MVVLSQLVISEVVTALYSSITNKMQRYPMVFIIINALHVSGGSSAHHEELKTVYSASGICRAFSAAIVGKELTHDSGSSKQAWHIPDAVYTVLSS